MNPPPPNYSFKVVYLARDSIYVIARYMLSPIRPSVCPSVTRVDQSKIVALTIMQLSPPSSPMTLVSSWLIHRKIPKGTQGAGAANERGGQNTQFSANKSPYLSNGAR